MPSPLLWVVYVVRGLTSQLRTTRRYVGLVKLGTGEGPQEAVERRLKEHERTLGKRGALWLPHLPQAWQGAVLGVVRRVRSPYLQALHDGMNKRRKQLIKAKGGPIGK